jgi:hypothetical protein
LGRIVVLLPPVAAAVSDCGSICLTMLSKDWKVKKYNND